MLLREVVGVKHGSLNTEIDAARAILPAWIIEGLHQLRQVGNFALHPSKDALTGELMEPEPGEADLTIEMVSALFQHLFAGKEAAARLAAAVAARKPGP